MEFNLADLFECVAARVPEREALIWGDTRLTFQQLDERATRLAHGLAQMRRQRAGSCSPTRFGSTPTNISVRLASNSRASRLLLWE